MASRSMNRLRADGDPMKRPSICGVSQDNVTACAKSACDAFTPLIFTARLDLSGWPSRQPVPTDATPCGPFKSAKTDQAGIWQSVSVCCWSPRYPSSSRRARRSPLPGASIETASIRFVFPAPLGPVRTTASLSRSRSAIS